jgi:hypothetical protein
MRSLTGPKGIPSYGFPGFAPIKPPPSVSPPCKPHRARRAALACEIAIPLDTGTQVFVWVFGYVCVYVCIYIYMHTHTHTHTRTHIHTHAHTLTLTLTHTQHIWIVNVALDQESEESRLLQMNSIINHLEQLEPSCRDAHVLCGGFHCLRRSDYSDGAWDTLARDAARARAGGEEDSQEPKDVVMAELLKRYRDAREEASLHNSSSYDMYPPPHMTCILLLI